MSQVAAPPAPPAAAPAGARPAGGWRRTWRRWRNPIGLIGAAIIAATIVVAVAAPLIAPYEPSSQAHRRLLPPSPQYPMGTDELGRDTFSRIVFGSRVSLQVGALAVMIALALGTTMGVLAGFYRGRVDDWIMRLVDIMFAFPGLVLAIVIAGLLGPSRTNAMIAIGIVYAPSFARLIRASVLSLKEKEFVDAARVLGGADVRIVLRHIVPNLLAPVIVQTTFSFSTAILAEAALSFLGLGTPPPNPSWGTMLSASRRYVELAPWPAIFPGLAIMLVVLGFNLFGDGLRDVLDPRLRTSD